MNLFFNYSIDCELPPCTDYTEGMERRDFFHGPATWAFAEASVRGFVDRMAALGVAAGTTLFVYPDVAQHQRALYREMADRGVEIALHLNGLRYSRLRGDRAKWLGEMTYDEQYEALRMAKRDLEDVIGAPCLGYRACYGSANDDTFPICEQLGFTWASNSSGRYRPEFAADWRDSFPYAHRANRECKRLCGEMALVEVPVSRGLTICFDNNPDQPFDLRVETPPSMLGADQRIIRDIIAENVREMDRRGVPVRAVIGASHNTSAYDDRDTHQSQNLDWIVQHAQAVAIEHGLTFTPAPFTEMVKHLQPSCSTSP